MAAITCSLCCEQNFENKELYIDHLKKVSKKLKCTSCPIRFDNVMVMIKHLEKCNGPLNPPYTTVLEQDNCKTEDQNWEMKMDVDDDKDCGEEFLDKDIHDEDSQDEASTAIVEENEYVDKNGNVYRRRVVKMRDIWTDEDTKKLIMEDGSSSSDDSDVDEVTPIILSSSRCPLCSLKIKGSDSLRAHIVTKHPRAVRACPQCAKIFRVGQLQKHIDSKHNTPFSCVYCAKPFNKLEKARKHAASHVKSRKHTCDVCQLVCCNYLDLKHHYKQMHRDLLHPKDVPQPISSYKCNSMWYEYRGHTYRHIKVKKDSGTQVMSCWVNECWVTLRVPIIGDVLIVGEHNHPAYPWVAERNELYTSLRHRTMTELTPLRVIYEEEAIKFPVGAKHLPFPETSMRTWRKNAMDTNENTSKKCVRSRNNADEEQIVMYI